MFEIMSQSSGKCIGVKVSGRVTASDYETLVPKLDEAIEVFGAVNMVFWIDKLISYETAAAKEDWAFFADEYKQVQRAAFVGDQKWVKWLTHIMSPFTRHTEEQYFEPEEIQKAWIWACGKSDEEG